MSGTTLILYVAMLLVHKCATRWCIYYALSKAGHLEGIPVWNKTWGHPQLSLAVLHPSLVPLPIVSNIGGSHCSDWRRLCGSKRATFAPCPIETMRPQQHYVHL